eukprot:GEMP01001063.1.p1 GENE.GEMP01001063.1~~GEMP01001063.1.p1  ORF type:complete len:1098 (+),score=255.21 GEMP01001063.1:348-3641(+)
MVFDSSRYPIWDPLTVGAADYRPGLICNATLAATGNWYSCVAIICAMCFVLSLKGLSDVKTAKWGCIYGSIGMFLAVIGTWFTAQVCADGVWIMWIAIVPGALIGTVMAMKVTMIQMPQLVGLLNSFGGLASALEALGLFMDRDQKDGPNGPGSQPVERVIQSVSLYLAIIIGSITFFGSILAACKLLGYVASKARIVPVRWLFNIFIFGGIIAACVVAEEGPRDHFGYGSGGGSALVVLVFVLSGVWGIQFVFAIGGADMPVVICVLNTGSGLAGVFAGFMLASQLLVITGTFVASSGMILSVIMCVAMNRSIIGVLVGGFGETGGAPASTGEVITGEIKEISSDELAADFNSAKEIVIVPGYGMAAGKAQHAVAAVIKILRSRGIKVRFAIHPVAGRLPGHMNVLLAEAKVPYDIVKEMDDINPDFEKTDVVLVLGANDIVNPSAQDDPSSPIAGMPVLEVWNAKKTVVVKRGQGTGYSGVENPLFYKDNNFMYYGNAAHKMDELEGKLKSMAAVGGGGNAKAVETDAVAVVVKEILAPCAAPKITIGVLEEDCEVWEKRVGLVPSICGKLTKLNYGIVVQKGAGKNSGFLDQEYIDNGAIIKDSREEIIAAAEIINTVMPSSELHAASALLNGKYVVCWVGKLTPDGKELVQKAADAGINLIDVTAVPRITIAQKLDVLSSQAKIAGVRGTVEAAALYQRFFPQEMTAAGKYPPAQIMVLGAGVAGLAAIGQARALGAEVRAWDVRDVSDQVESMGGKWITVDFNEEGAGQGGYAKESSQAFQEAQKATFHKHCKECDIIITTAAIPGRRSPLLIEEYMVKDMKTGSVIIDLAAMGGGNCAVTKKNETYKYDNKVTICGALDFPSRMGMQASDMYAANMFNMYNHIACVTNKKGDAGDVVPTIMAVMQKKIEDVVTSQILCTFEGVVLNPGPPPMPSAPPPKKGDDKNAGDTKRKAIKKVSAGGDSFIMTTQFMVFVLFLICIGLAFMDHKILIELILVFVLSAWIGYMLVWNVQPALHTPLMSVSNAISGQVILGGIVMVSARWGLLDGQTGSGGKLATSILAIVAIFVASINVFGGFVITLQMLKMFKVEKE